MTHKKRKFITIHSSSSYGIGGIEQLIRGLQKVASTLDFEIVEIFYSFGTGRHYKNKIERKFIETGNKKEGKLLNYIKKNIRTKAAIRRETKSKGESIVVFHPKSIFMIPLTSLINNKVILVQSNRLDIIFSSWRSRLAIRLFHRLIDYVTVYTKSDMKKLVRMYPLLREKVVVIPRACKIETSSEPSIYKDKLVTIARIKENHKNFSDLVEIFKKLPDCFQLNIYGDGPSEEKKALEMLIEGEKGIQFHGVTLDVESALKENAIFVMTSHYEGFGQTLIEARSQGLPIVLYDTFPAASWIVQDGINGYLIKYKDVNHFVEKITFLKENPDIYNVLSKNALKMAIETDRVSIDRKWANILKNNLQ